MKVSPYPVALSVLAGLSLILGFQSLFDDEWMRAVVAVLGGVALLAYARERTTRSLSSRWARRCSRQIR